MAKKPIKRASKMPADKVKKYSGGHVYIVDDYNENESNSRRSKTSASLGVKQKTTEHQDNCDYIRALFGKYFGYEIHSVKFEPGTREDTVHDYFQDIVDNADPDELMIFYFDGGAGYNGTEYSW